MVHIINLLFKRQKKCIPWSQIFAVMTVCLPAFVHGLQVGWTSPYIPVLISKDSTIPGITLEEASYLSVLPAMAAIISAPAFAKLLNIIGRKPTILIIAIPQLIAWLMVAFGDSLVMLYVARLINGIADGAVFTAIPVYIGEILEPSVRGTLGSYLSFAIYFGIFILNVVGSYASIQMVALICASLPVIFFAAFLIMPETPYYLLMRNQKENARKALKKLRTVEDVEEELLKLKEDVQRQLSESSSLKDLFTIDTNRRALAIATGLRIAHQLSGISAFNVYTQYLFEKSGGNLDQNVSAIIFTGLQTAVICFAPLSVDRFGRRPLMILSSLGCTISLTIETVYFYLIENTNLDLSFINWIPIAGMMLFIVAFCIGYGIVPMLVVSELFSASIKNKASCLMSAFLAFCSAVTPKLFQVMAENFGLFAPFCLFTVSGVLSVLFSYYCIPETKGKSLEEIQQCLKRTKVKDSVSDITINPSYTFKCNF